MKKIGYLTICCFLLGWGAAWANPQQLIQDYVDNHSTANLDSFYQDFPFAELVQYLDLRQIKEVEGIRQLLENRGVSGDPMIEGLYKEYLKQYPINLNNPDSTKLVFSIAETLGASVYFLPDSVWQFIGASMYLLDEMESVVKDQLDAGTLQKGDEYTHYLIDRLGNNEYYLNLPPSNVEKLINYAKNGKFGYIWHKMKTTYRSEALLFLAAVAISFVFLLGFVRSWKKRRRKRRLQGDLA